jgi:hypothetical protein
LRWHRTTITTERFTGAYDVAIGRCSTATLPGTSFPRTASGIGISHQQLLIETLEGMNLTYPNPDRDVKALKRSLGQAA